MENKMKTMTVNVSMGRVGCHKEESFEVEADCSEKELEEIAKEAMFSMIEWGWKVDDENL